MIWIVILMAFLGGMVQGITGFGGGIVMMMVFPMVFPLTLAAGINGAILVFLNTTMVYVYRKHINVKMVLPVFLFSIIVSSLTIKIAAGTSPLIIKKLFGGFLLLLAIYYLFIKKDGRPDPMNIFVSLLFLTVSQGAQNRGQQVICHHNGNAHKHDPQIQQIGRAHV